VDPTKCKNTSLAQRVPAHFFVKCIPVPPQHKKYCIDVLRSGCTGMHYVIHRSYRMQNHKFSVTCLGTHFDNPYQSHPSMKNSVSTFCTPIALECTTRSVDRTGRTGMYYVTHRSYRMQNHKFGVTCLGALFVNPYWSHPSI
jgi:hypothetical protein